LEIQVKRVCQEDQVLMDSLVFVEIQDTLELRDTQLVSQEVLQYLETLVCQVLRVILVIGVVME